MSRCIFTGMMISLSYRVSLLLDKKIFRKSSRSVWFFVNFYVRCPFYEKVATFCAKRLISSRHSALDWCTYCIEHLIMSAFTNLSLAVQLTLKGNWGILQNLPPPKAILVCVLFDLLCSSFLGVLIYPTDYRGTRGRYVLIRQDAKVSSFATRKNILQVMMTSLWTQGVSYLNEQNTT